MSIAALRVALFTDSDVFAGTESYIFDLGRGLRDIGVDVTMACPMPSALGQKAQGDGFRILPVPKGGLIDREAIRILVPHLRSGVIDIIHANNGRTMLSAAMAVARARRGACVATQHFLEPDHVGRRGVKALLFNLAHGWVNRRTSHFIAISDAVRRAMLARGEATERNTTVVLNGIQPPDPTALRSGADMRTELGIGLDTPMIVCAARLEREKDIATLILAMSTVRRTCPDAVCLIAGEGSLKEPLDMQIRQAELADRVRLLGFRSDAKALIRAADIFVLPSLAEPFGLVILEAMAVEKPVIAMRSGAPPEIVVDGETGLLAPPSDAPALAAAITRLVSEPETARTMGQKGRVRFETHFTAARMARDTFAVYRHVVGG